MTAETIHTCSYSCERPECIRAQRDELAARMAATPDEIAEMVRKAVESERERCARVCESLGGNGPGYIDDDWARMCAAAIRDSRAQQPEASTPVGVGRKDLISAARSLRKAERAIGRALTATAARDAEIEALRAEVERLRAKTACTMGVGDGGGQLFVHGDYESIKAAQALVFRSEQAEARAERLAEALRGWIWARESGASEELVVQYARAALEQESGRWQQAGAEGLEDGAKPGSRREAQRVIRRGCPGYGAPVGR